ncbi:MAG: hypothetical protein CL766_01830 [Chloroflexi bacterium]|jgi:L-iditol 2-dehydrogenase|nr:hypothetical protein [Chloroflexota bacterium]MCH2305240.1 zinc-binding dehydrogenase [SAR202 cluster bacterium]|tara:strand:+ start:455 stop:1432 length:978 start_codon:yes stop_codon:yes gene_type:complete
MKAARLTGPKKISFEDAPIPEIKSSQSLIKLHYVSICGSDIRHAYGPVLPEEEYPLKLGNPCHELVGTIAETRSEKFKEGQRVIVLPSEESSGGLVEYIAGDEDKIALLPEHGDLKEWMMCQPSGTVLYACQQIGTILGKTVLILGQGGIGLSFSAICARAGASKVIATDLFDYRLEYAKKFGATHTINPNSESIDEAITEITQGQGADITIEAAGYPETLNSSIRLVKKFGKVILFGIQDGFNNKTVSLDTQYILPKAATIIPTAGGSSGDSIGHINRMIELKDRGWWNPGEMITHNSSFESANDAYEMYENRTDNIIKVAISI